MPFPINPLRASLRILLPAFLYLPLVVPAQAQVSLPNGTVGEVITDLKVQTVSGLITVDRQFREGRWRIDPR
jgi:hypothetical protein